MLFSSPIFLFIFLPLVTIIYYLSPRGFRNAILLIASIIFYAWGEGRFVFIILSLVLANYVFGIKIFDCKENRKKAKRYLLLSILVNLCFLFYYKYTGFLLINLALLFKTGFANIDKIYLPLAISFFTFHTISYNFDIYRKKNQPQRNFFKLALYLLLFPHLLAGPIIRYHTISSQLDGRGFKIAYFAYGIKRFIFGLAKKVLIADTLAPVVEEIFAQPVSHIGLATSWVGIISFTLQIFFDFSGYSDMAIGLGYMFGFKFPENFNYPYISASIGEFWQRWHMTLGRWFRDYVYIPLGGSRHSSLRNYLNIIFVFFLTGVWHGAGWNFIVWGLLQAFFIVLERFNGGVFMKYLWSPLKYLYAILAIMIGWVFFQSDSLSHALGYLGSMFGLKNFQNIVEYHPLNYYLRNDVILALVLGIIFSLPIYPKIISLLAKIQKKFILDENFAFQFGGLSVNLTILIILLLFALMTVAAQTYNPFIYFRF